MAEIGGRYSLSRERVRQILKKAGVSKNDGGVCVRKNLRLKTLLQNKFKKKEERIKRNYKCSIQEYELITKGFSFKLSKQCVPYCYRQHKTNAEIRGIKFNLSFPEWWQVWRESGKWGVKGREKGQFVMTRRNDIGAYELGNVTIKTTGENIEEYYANKSH